MICQQKSLEKSVSNHLHIQIQLLKSLVIVIGIILGITCLIFCTINVKKVTPTFDYAKNAFWLRFPAILKHKFLKSRPFKLICS